MVETALPKVKWRYNPEQDGDWRFEPGRVELRANSGEVHHAISKTALGHPDNPMTEQQRHEKFLQCVAVAARPMSKAHATAIIDIVGMLECCDDIRRMLELVA